MSRTPEREAANRILSDLQTACGEAAYDCVENGAAWDEKIKRKIKKAKKQSIRDISGWLADEFYNDKDFIYDFIGDRVFDYAMGDKETEKKILKELSGCGHRALLQAVQRLMKGD